MATEAFSAVAVAADVEAVAAGGGRAAAAVAEAASAGGGFSGGARPSASPSYQPQPFHEPGCGAGSTSGRGQPPSDCRAAVQQPSALVPRPGAGGVAGARPGAAALQVLALAPEGCQVRAPDLHSVPRRAN